METNNINLIVFDNKDNFEKTKEFLGFEGSTLKSLFCIQDLEQFEYTLEKKLKDDDLFFFVVHIFGKTDNLEGISKFKSSGISNKYPNLEYMFISDGNKQLDMKKAMLDNQFEVEPVFKYHQVLDELRNERKKPITKKQLNNPKNLNIYKKLKNNKDYPQCDYAIITALEKDEMEKILPFIEFKGRIENSKHLIEYGHLKGNKSKKIVYVSQQETGMIDASILATEIITRFNPKFLIMPGVMGGKPEKTEIGNIIVSNKVFTIDKGKLTDEAFEKEIESSNTKSSYTTLFERESDKIIQFIKDEDSTRNIIQKIHFEPIACVRKVIDKEGYFIENITSVDRKTIGLEMESYGIVRACELVNDGKTIPLIIKSVMDNTQDKTDGAKTYAAWTSSMFVKYILENDLI